MAQLIESSTDLAAFIAERALTIAMDGLGLAREVAAIGAGWQSLDAAFLQMQNTNVNPQLKGGERKDLDDGHRLVREQLQLDEATFAQANFISHYSGGRRGGIRGIRLLVVAIAFCRIWTAIGHQPALGQARMALAAAAWGITTD
jgi:hypothetical protein